MRSLFVLLCLAFPCAAGAATYLIEPDGSGDFPTIQAAVDAAAGGDIIELADGTFTGPGNRDIEISGLNITIRSASGNPAACTIYVSGGPGEMRRGFFIEDCTTALEGITIKGGYQSDGGAIYLTQGAPIISHCVIYGNDATEDGGGIYALELTGGTIGYCTFLSNRSGGAGGGLYCDACMNLDVGQCEFDGNESDSDGGAAALLDSEVGFYGGLLTENTAASQGGGVCASGGSDVTFNSVLLQHNHAAQGGALAATEQTTGELELCTLIWNSAAQLGGALYASETAQLAVLRSTFCAGSAPQGGGLYVTHAALATLERTIIAFSTLGAAVSGSQAPATALTCCDLHGNAGGDWVGGIAGQLGQYGNINLDPLFCDPVCDCFTLAQASPCAAENNPQCGQIGAYGLACEQPIYFVKTDGSGLFPTIQAAIAAAADGGIVELTDGTFTGDGNRDINFMGKPITVRSRSGDPETCVIDCGGTPQESHRAFLFNSEEGLGSILENIQITGGYEGNLDYGSAIHFTANATPTIRGCIFRENYSETYSTLNYWPDSGGSLTQCRFERNTSGVYGGAIGIWSVDEDFELANCVFTENTSRLGGAINILSRLEVIRDCEFSGNRALRGGAVYCNPGTGEIRFEGCSFGANRCDSLDTGPAGGAVASFHKTTQMRFIECEFCDNHVNGIEGYGGGITGRAVACSLCTFTGNHAYRGGAIHAGGLHLGACDLAGNMAEAGGAVYADSVLLVEDCSFTQNNATIAGGILTGGVIPWDECNIYDSDFIGNTGTAHTGAIDLADAGTVAGCYFAENNGSFGGAIHARGYTNYFTAEDCTFDHNSWHAIATIGGAIIRRCTIYRSEGAQVTFDATNVHVALNHNIIAFGEGSAVLVAENPIFVIHCCDIHGNAGGDWTGLFSNFLGQDGNIDLDPLFCLENNPEEPLTLSSDSPCAAENNPGCGQIGAWPVGCDPSAGVDDEPLATLRIAVTGAQPSQGATHLALHLPSALMGTPLEITICDATGRRVRTLVKERAASGRQAITWDGRSEDGQRCSAGLYYCHARVGTEAITRSVVLLP